MIHTTKRITPAIAEEMLRNNIANRPVSDRRVAKFAQDMLCGRWKVNGDTICMNGNRLIDGQHRLHAVIASGVTIKTIVVEDLPSDVFDTKDIGGRRTAADTLAVRGEVNTKNLAAGLAVLDRYLTGRITLKTRYSNMEIEELLEKYPDIRRSVPIGMRTRKLLQPAILIACHYLFAQKDEAAADQFVHDLIGGQGLTESDPVYLLRERILQNYMSKSKLVPHYIMALMIKAWNGRRTGKPVRYIGLREEGARKEAFPTVV